MGFTVYQCFHIWWLATDELHFGGDGLHQQLNVGVVLGWGQVEGEWSWVDEAGEVVGGGGEEQVLLIPSQDIGGHDEEHHCQAEQETVQFSSPEES